MFLKYLQGSNVYLDETEGDGSDAGGDRGDNTEVDEVEVEETEVEEGAEPEVKKEEKKAEARMVPHARMKEAVDKERRARESAETKLKAAEDKAAEANRGVDVDKLNAEIEDLEDKIDAAQADNNVELKKALRKELRAAMQTLSRADSTALSMQATAIAVERVRYDSLVERLETQHPSMNPEHEDYDEDAIAEIVDLKSGFEAKGESSSEALKKAVKYVFKQAKAVEKEEEVEEEEEGIIKEAKKALRETPTAKAQRVKAAQPPTMQSGKASDKGGGGIKGNLNKLSDPEFDKLEERELAKLRGDFV